MTVKHCPKCDRDILPTSKDECPSCSSPLGAIAFSELKTPPEPRPASATEEPAKIPPDSDPFSVSCTKFTGILKTWMLLGVAGILPSMMTRNTWGQVSVAFTPLTAILLGIIAVIVLARFMVRQKRGIQVWGPIMVVLAGISLLGRTDLLFGRDSELPILAKIFVIVGAFVDVGVVVFAVAMVNAWRRARQPVLSEEETAAMERQGRDQVRASLKPSERMCDACGSKYKVGDYDAASQKWFCSACKAELPRDR